MPAFFHPQAAAGPVSARRGVRHRAEAGDDRPPPFATAYALLSAVRAALPELSPQQRRIAQHLLKHPLYLAYSGIEEWAEQVDVTPSAIVGFAKRLGFTGFAPMKRIFRDHLHHLVVQRADGLAWGLEG
jgi:Helix-turn-helix domain, rpiR family